jgi:hypothetical protein
LCSHENRRTGAGGRPFAFGAREEAARLRSALAKKPRALDALKEFYSVWRAALEDADISSDAKNSASVALVRQKAIAVRTEVEW